MNEIEKMEKYVERTKVKAGDRYYLNFGEASALARQADNGLLNVIDLAFNYGRAKGYRAAKAEVRA